MDPYANAPTGDHGSSNLVNALLDPSKFGSGGIVPRTLQFLPFVTTIAPNSLVDAAGNRLVDVFFAGLTGITLTTAEANELGAFLLAGGILYISGNTASNEGPSYNPLFVALGGTDSYSTATVGTGNFVESSTPASTPITTGSFGVVGPLLHTPFRVILTGTCTTGVAMGHASTSFILAEGSIGSGYISMTGDPLYFNFFTGPDPDNMNYFLNLFALAVTTPPVAPPPPVYAEILPVPYYYQGDTDWCVPTSMSMIFKHYSQNIHSWDIAKDWGWGRDIEWWKFWTPLFTTVRSYFDDRDLTTDLYFCSPLWPIDYDDIFSNIKDWIDADMPVLLAMSEVNHTVVIVGYEIDDGTRKIYISDPSGALVSDNMDLDVSYPYVAISASWNDVTQHIGWGSYLIAVGDTPQPPKGTIDIQDYGVYFSTAEKPGMPYVYSWLYGLDKGLVWENIPIHPLALNPENQFKIENPLANHMKDQQTYLFEISFAVYDPSTTLWVPFSTLSLDVSIEGYSSKPVQAGPYSLRDLFFPGYGEYTVTLRLWDELHTELYDEITFPSIEYGPVVSFRLDSPAYLYVTDPLGRHVGVDPSTGEMVNEIPDAVYTGPGSEPQVIAVPNPLDGNYEVLLIGTATGIYSVTTEFFTLQETITQTYTGETVEGAVYVYSVTITDEVMTVDPDPITELEYLKEFIMNLPDDSFDQSIRRASHLKKALSNKIDEVVLKVEAGNYTDAMNKLLYDIRAKMDGDSTAQDWIIDPTTQFALCVIIDHIISNIEILQEKGG